MSSNDKKLMLLKAEQRARSARDEQLRKLIDQSSSSIEDRIAAVKTVMQADQVRFSSSIKKMMEK
jgi:ferritin-like metal-binding protein YciE